ADVRDHREAEVGQRDALSGEAVVGPQGVAGGVVEAERLRRCGAAGREAEGQLAGGAVGVLPGELEAVLRDAAAERDVSDRAEGEQQIVEVVDDVQAALRGDGQAAGADRCRLGAARRAQLAYLPLELGDAPVHLARVELVGDAVGDADHYRCPTTWKSPDGSAGGIRAPTRSPRESMTAIPAPGGSGPLAARSSWTRPCRPVSRRSTASGSYSTSSSFSTAAMSASCEHGGELVVREVQ